MASRNEVTAQPNVQIITIQQSTPDNGCCPSSEYSSYKSQSSRILGIIQITVAFLCMIFHIVGMVAQGDRPKENEVYSIGASFWCGCIFLVSGSLAIAAANKRTGGLVVGSLVFAIFSAVMAVVYMAFSAATVSEEDELATSYSFIFFGVISQSSTTDIDDRSSAAKTSYAMAVLMLILSFVEIITSIAVSGLGCAVTCCGPRPGRLQTSRATVIPAVGYHTTTQTTYIGTTVPGRSQGPGAVVGNNTYGGQPMYPAQPPQPPAYYPSTAPPTYVEQQGPADVHMPYPATAGAPPAPSKY